MGKTNIATAAIIILALAVVVGVGFMMWNSGQPQVPPADPDSPAACPDSTGILTINGVNAAIPGTDVTATYNAGVDGGAVTTAVVSGTTVFPVGAMLTILGNASDYLDKSLEVKMACGGIVVDLPLWSSTSDNPSIKIENDDGSWMGDEGVTANQTDISAGETLVLKVRFTGTYQESSGDGIYIIESPANTGSNITTMELDGQACGSKPSVHAGANAGSKICAFSIPAIEGSGNVDYTLSIVTTGDISGLVLTDWYAKQDFVDDDGTIGTGIQDSDGTAKYENTLDWDFYIDA